MRFSFISKGVSFLKTQERDWKITVTRTSIDRFAYQMVFPYLSIYIVALGATATQLGLVNSLGMLVAGICGPLIGWFIDQRGPKNLYLSGIGLLAISYLTYALAHSWTLVIIAMVTYWLGNSVSIQSCATICGNCLMTKDRATGMMICETAGAGLLGMIGPMLGALLVANLGGVTVSGIRPLFFFALVGTAISFTIVLTQLSSRRWGMAKLGRPHLLRDLGQVLRGGSHLKRWLVVAAVSQLPLAMVFPFSQVFAHTVKGANQFALGAMVTGASLASILFAIPLGRLADRIGRKRVLYATMPLFWLSNLMLILAPNPGILIFAGALQGFYYIGGPISGAIERELVPADQMGRWIGILRLIKMFANAAFAFLAGIIWDKIGPQYVFLTFVGIDLFIRLPFLISMPETLKSRSLKPAEA